MNVAYKPFIIGIMMGPMMLWMLHSQLTGANDLPAATAIAFVGAHVLLALVLIGGALFATRLSPRASAWINRLHRPSAHHIVWMMGGAILTTALIHLSVHGLTL